MDIVLDFLGSALEGITDLYAIVIALPEEVYLPALGVFVFVGFLKALNVVGENDQAAAANVVLSIAANYGNLGEENAAIVLGATAVGAAAIYKLWSRGIVPAYEWLRARAVRT